MSSTGPAVLVEVRGLIGDTASGNNVIEDDAIQREIGRQVAVVAKELGVRSSWSLAAVTLNTSDKDYALPTGVEYQQILQVVYSSDGQKLTPRPEGEVVEARAGNVAIGRQYTYAVHVNPDQSVELWLPGLPAESETLDLLISTEPARWAVGATSAPTIPFSETALRALELLTGAALGKAMGPERVSALRLNPNVFDDWRAQGKELIRQERLTIIRLQRALGPGVDWTSAWAR